MMRTPTFVLTLLLGMVGAGAVSATPMAASRHPLPAPPSTCTFPLFVAVTEAKVVKLADQKRAPSTSLRS